MKSLAPILAASLVLASPAMAASSQLRFAVSPNAANAVWNSKGVLFQKRGECSFSGPGVAAPVAVMGRGGAQASYVAKGPLFNPGFPHPGGTYGPGPDDGFNTLFIETNFPSDPNAVMTCKGAILVNGIDMTLPPRGGWPSATLMQIGGKGPLTVAPQLDLAKFNAYYAALPKLVYEGSGFYYTFSNLNGYGFNTESYTNLETGIPQKGFDNNLTIYPEGMGKLPWPITALSFRAGYGAQMATSLNSESWDKAGIETCRKKAYAPNGALTLKAGTGSLCMKTVQGRTALISLNGISNSEEKRPDGSVVNHYTVSVSIKVWQ